MGKRRHRFRGCPKSCGMRVRGPARASPRYEARHSGRSSDLPHPCFCVVSLALKVPPLGDLSQEPGGPRSPAVFGSIVSYIEQFFETVGISLADRQVHLALPSPHPWEDVCVVTTVFSPKMFILMDNCRVYLCA